MAACDLVLGPIIAAFNPDLVLVSAGFDAVEGDPLVRSSQLDCAAAVCRHIMNF